jgi:hypothetical protein
MYYSIDSKIKLIRLKSNQFRDLEINYIYNPKVMKIPNDNDIVDDNGNANESGSEYVPSENSGEELEESSEESEKSSNINFKKRKIITNEESSESSDYSEDSFEVTEEAVQLANNIMMAMVTIGNEYIQQEQKNPPPAPEVPVDKHINKKIKLMREEIEKINKNQEKTDISSQVLLSKLSMEDKASIIAKIEDPYMYHSDKNKIASWVRSILQIPFETFKELPVKSSDPAHKINNFLVNARRILDSTVYGMESTKEEIIDFLTKFISNPSAKGTVLGLHGSPGVGKCFAKDTPILMYDGTVKAVQDIVEGDILMGDNSTPRNVLALGEGNDEMYSIANRNGDVYTVNSEHILCLRYNRNKKLIHKPLQSRYIVEWFDSSQMKIRYKTFEYSKNDQVKSFLRAKRFLQSLSSERMCEITVKKYLDLDDLVKSRLHGYSTSVFFFEKPTSLSPYLFGYFLGANNNCGGSASTIRYPDLTNKMLSLLSEHKCNLRHTRVGFFDIDPDDLSFFDLLPKDVSIPHEYKCNSVENRRELLNGITEFWGIKCSKEFRDSIVINSSTRAFLEDIAYIAKSLGYECCVSQISENNEEYKGSLIICDLGTERTELTERSDIERSEMYEQTERSEVYSVKITSLPIKVDHVGYGKYYGFTLDDNERFVLGNFIVTHNTKICKALSEILQLPMFQISLGGMKDSNVLLGHDMTYIGAKCGRISDIIKKAKCMNPIIYLDELDKISSDNNSTSEIYSTLTHLLDETQNFEFTDLFFQEISIDLSKVLFVTSFNNIESIDPIVFNRIKVIKIDDLTNDDKICIVEKYLLPELWTRRDTQLHFPKSVIEYLVADKTTREPGVRNVKKNIESILNKLNTMLILEKCKDSDKIKNNFSYEKLLINRDAFGRVVITTKMIDAILRKSCGKEEWRNMYV